MMIKGDPVSDWDRTIERLKNQGYSEDEISDYMETLSDKAVWYGMDG